MSLEVIGARFVGIRPTRQGLTLLLCHPDKPSKSIHEASSVLALEFRKLICQLLFGIQSPAVVNAQCVRGVSFGWCGPGYVNPSYKAARPHLVSPTITSNSKNN